MSVIGSVMASVMGNLIAGLIVMVLVGLAVWSMVRDKRNGKSPQCGGDCGHCGRGCR